MGLLKHTKFNNMDYLTLKQLQPCTIHSVVCSASIDDVKNGKVIIDMRGSEKWGKKVNRLFEILKQAAPKKEKMPAYSFAPFYYCENGYWYESTWRETGSVPVLDICD
jgi:hypothetical protein